MVPPRDRGLSGLNEVLPSLDFMALCPSTSYCDVWYLSTGGLSDLGEVLPSLEHLLFCTSCFPMMIVFLTILKLKLYLQQLEQGVLAYCASSVLPFGVRDFLF